MIGTRQGKRSGVIISYQYIRAKGKKGGAALRKPVWQYDPVVIINKHIGHGGKWQHASGFLFRCDPGKGGVNRADDGCHCIYLTFQLFKTSADELCMYNHKR